jgi:hypothetical protein
MLGESKNQFSLTRPALSTFGAQMQLLINSIQFATVGLADGLRDGDANGAEKRSDALILGVALWSP